MTRHSPGYRNYINSPEWHQKSRWVRSLTGHRCILFPWLGARETHHLTYNFFLGFGWNSWGFEQPGWHLVPLSKTAHKFVHFRLFRRQPIQLIVNTYLRLSFLLWWSLFNLIWSIPLWLGVFLSWLWLFKGINVSFQANEFFQKLLSLTPSQQIIEFVDQLKLLFIK